MMKRIAAPLLACLMLATAGLAQTSAHHDHATMDHDRMFADCMAKHHEDGIKMAQMAVDKAENAELRSMAQKMIDDQRREIGQLQTLRGEGPMTPMSEMMKMPGMMPESAMQRDMARLESAPGHAFDVAFTEIMSKHHEGAIKMSNHELQVGASSDLKELARTIADKQTRERRQLMVMHEDLSAGHEAMTSSSSGRQRMTKD